MSIMPMSRTVKVPQFEILCPASPRNQLTQIDSFLVFAQISANKLISGIVWTFCDLGCENASRVLNRRVHR